MLSRARGANRPNGIQKRYQRAACRGRGGRRAFSLRRGTGGRRIRRRRVLHDLRIPAHVDRVPALEGAPLLGGRLPAQLHAPHISGARGARARVRRLGRLSLSAARLHAPRAQRHLGHAVPLELRVRQRRRRLLRARRTSQYPAAYVVACRGVAVLSRLRVAVPLLLAAVGRRRARIGMGPVRRAVRRVARPWCVYARRTISRPPSICLSRARGNSWRVRRSCSPRSPDSARAIRIPAGACSFP